MIVVIGDHGRARETCVEPFARCFSSKGRTWAGVMIGLEESDMTYTRHFCVVLYVFRACFVVCSHTFVDGLSRCGILLSM